MIGGLEEAKEERGAIMKSRNGPKTTSPTPWTFLGLPHLWNFSETLAWITYVADHLTLHKEAKNGIRLVPFGIIVPFLKTKSKIKIHEGKQQRL